MTFPHDLSDLRDPRKPTVLLCGAGLSVGTVPSAASLYQNHCERAEEQLSLSGAINHDGFMTLDEAARLYAWADAVLEELRQRGVARPKLKLALALGLLDDPRWWGRSEIAFRGSSPRHRVIARFAKEGLWYSVWSFNWDCILENTLEQVGLPNGPPPFATPWDKDHYAIHVHSDYFPATTNPSGLVVHKPHGCVRALREAADAEKMGDATKADELSYRFMVGQKELSDRSTDGKAQKEDQLFTNQLGSEVPSKLNLLMGWSLGEESMISQLEACVSYQGTSIAILDPKVSDGHKRICRAASLQPAFVHFELDYDDCPNRDDLFLWQQTLHTLDTLEAQNDGNVLVDLEGRAWRTTAGECPRNGFLCSWADEFLPVWTRLCWSAGLVTAQRMPSHRIDLDRQDEHIPIGYDHVPRPDLQAAALMLRNIPALGDGINAQDYPGGLLVESTQTLVVPLPCWGELNELRALKPLVDALRSRLGFVQRLAVWPQMGEAIASDDKRSECTERLVERLAALMPIPEFATREGISIINQISEASHASH